MHRRNPCEVVELDLAGHAVGEHDGALVGLLLLVVIAAVVRG